MIPICTEVENLIHPAMLREDEYMEDDLLQQMPDTPAAMFRNILKEYADMVWSKSKMNWNGGDEKLPWEWTSGIPQ